MDRCWSEIRGEGPRVVLVHGTMDRSTSFGRICRRLERDHTVVRYDRRGYGRSAALGPPGDGSQQVDDLLDVVGDEPVVAFGHSYGGTIALAAAVRSPSLFRSVFAFEAPQPWLPWWPDSSAGARAAATAGDPADTAERFVRRMIGDERWRRLPPSTKQARRNEGATLVAEMAHLRPPHEALFVAADLTVPVVAGHGSRSSVHHRRTAESLAATAPDGRLVVIEGSAHGVHLTHAADVAAVLRELTVEW